MNEEEKKEEKENLKGGRRESEHLGQGGSVVGPAEVLSYSRTHCGPRIFNRSSNQGEGIGRVYFLVTLRCN